MIGENKLNLNNITNNLSETYEILEEINSGNLSLYSVYCQENSKTNKRKENYTKLTSLLNLILDNFYHLAFNQDYKKAYNLGCAILNSRISLIDLFNIRKLTFKEAVISEMLPVDYKRLLLTLLQTAYFSGDTIIDKARHIYNILKLDGLYKERIYEIEPEISFMEFLRLLKIDKNEKEVFLTFFYQFMDQKKTELSRLLSQQARLLLGNPDDLITLVKEEPEQNPQAALYTIKNIISKNKEKIKVGYNVVMKIGIPDSTGYEIAKFCSELLSKDFYIRLGNNDYWRNQFLLTMFASKPNLANLFNLILEYSLIGDSNEDLLLTVSNGLENLTEEKYLDENLLPIYRFFLEDFNRLEIYYKNRSGSPGIYDNLMASLMAYLISKKDSKSSEYLTELLSDYYNPESLVSLLQPNSEDFNFLNPEELSTKITTKLQRFKIKQKELSPEFIDSVLDSILPSFERIIDTFLNNNISYQLSYAAKYLVALDEILFSLGKIDSTGDYIESFLKSHKINEDFIADLNSLKL